MKKTLAILLATVAGMATSPLQAADIVTSPDYDWTGFYLGAHGGYGWATSETDDIKFYGLDPKGWFGGAQAGFNYQLPSNLVLGLEADVSFGDLEDHSLKLTPIFNSNIPTEASADVKTFGTVRGRIGYAFGRILPYATAGLGWARQEVDYFQDFLPNLPGTLVDELHDTKTYFGWTVGGGVEAAVTDNWTVKVEYLYADLGSKEYKGEVTILGPYPADIDLEVQTVRLGINYRFD